MQILRFIPLYAVLLVIYNILMFTGHMAENPQLFRIPLPSGAPEFFLRTGDILIMLGAVFYYFEIIKATSSSRMTTIDHMLSMIVFIIFLVELLVVPTAGTPTFMILTLMSLLDVVAGFTVTIATSRRDFSVGGNGNGF